MVGRFGQWASRHLGLVPNRAADTGDKVVDITFFIPYVLSGLTGVLDNQAETTNIVFTSLEVSWDTSGLTSIASLRS